MFDPESGQRVGNFNPAAPIPWRLENFSTIATTSSGSATVAATAMNDKKKKATTTTIALTPAPPPLHTLGFIVSPKAKLGALIYNEKLRYPHSSSHLMTNSNTAVATSTTSTTEGKQKDTPITTAAGGGGAVVMPTSTNIEVMWQCPTVAVAESLGAVVVTVNFKLRNTASWKQLSYSLQKSATR